MCFFPCVRFESKMPLMLRCQTPQTKNFSDTEKLEFSRKIAHEQVDFYDRFCELIMVGIKKNLRLVIENPYTQPHYLTHTCPIKPSLIDKDRTENGDYYKKPTQFYFINWKPYDNLVFEPIDCVETTTIDEGIKIDGISKTVARSMIHPQYANRFIRQYLIPDGDRYE